MKALPRITALAAVVALAVGAAASASHPATVGTHKTSLGRVLVDSRGHTLYIFEKDGRGKSKCSGTCATYWPPLVVRGKPKVGTGAKASLVGVRKRSNGALQVTYAGYPLYLYAEDTKPGQTRGEGSTDFGAGWDALPPAGKKIEHDG